MQIENWLFGTTQRICRTCFNRVFRDKNNHNKWWCSNCKRSIESEETLEKVASKFNISCAYPKDNDLWEFRIWGWIPTAKVSDGFKEKFLNGLKDWLSNANQEVENDWRNLLGCKTQNYSLKVWREFNSERDSVRKISDVNEYLQSLLDGEEQNEQ